MSDRFAQLDDYTRQEEELANTRSFTGNGTAFLEVPGLRKVTGVRIGQYQMPLTETREYPLDGTLARVEKVEEPMVDLQVRTDGTPFLVRSVLSNDGRWNNGETIYVTGDWQDEDDEDAEKSPRRRKAANKSEGDNKTD